MERAADNRFCERCLVSKDLHPSGEKSDEFEPVECEVADRKANLIENFAGGAFRGW